MEIWQLEPGSRFQLVGEDVTGFLMSPCTRKSGSAKVRVERGLKHHEFKDAGGTVHTFNSQDVRTILWSPRTLVIPIQGSMEEYAVASLNKKDRINQKGSKAAAPAKGAKEKAPKEKAPKVADKPCGCGCGEMVARTFRPGHDARYYGWLKRVKRGAMKWEELNPFVRKQLGNVNNIAAALAGHEKGDK